MTWGWQPLPVTRLRPQMVDDGHGNQVPDWDAAEQAVIPGWLYAPSTSSQEDRDGRVQGVRYAGEFFGPAFADVQAGDAVIYREQRYRLVGAPQQWFPGTVLEVERWDG